MKFNHTPKLQLSFFLTALTLLLRSPLTYATNTSLKDLFYNQQVIPDPNQVPNSLSDIYNPLVQNILLVAGIISLLGLLYGGYMYILGANQGSAEKIETGKRSFTWSFFSLVAFMAVYWIIEIIRIITGVDILNPDSLL